MMNSNIPKTVARMKRLNKTNKEDRFTTSKIDHELKTKKTNKIFNKLQNKNNIIIINPSDFFCKDTLCYGFMNNKILYRDNNHLSYYGGEVLYSELDKIF